MSKQPFPDAALDDRLFFAGTAGAGKTYNASGRVERLLAKKARVVIPDPLGVWWGLRLEPDGKTPSGYDVVIFGGPHGDLPLSEHAGALIGETVAGMKESCILDLSALGTKAAERRFMLAFLTALYKHASGEPLHVVFDEADMWAPQKIMDKEGDAARLYGMMETIVRRGRVKGFIPWLISQRPAVLAKDVLSQVDGLIAFKLTSSQDRDAIGDWVEGQADKQTWRETWGMLPTMARGQGVVWIPGRGILEVVQFPAKGTFDSSKTPSRGEKAHAVELRPLDLAKLRDRLGKVEAETKANDPKALRAEISRLQRELAEKPTAVKFDLEAIDEAEKRGFAQAERKLREAAEKQVKAAHLNILGVLAERLGPIHELFKEELAKAKAESRRLEIAYAPERTAPAARAVPRPAPSAPPRSAPRAKPPAPAGDGTYTRPQMKVLESLAMWFALGHDASRRGAPTREMVAAVAGYSPTSGGFNNLLGGLNTMGAISYPQPGFVQLEASGIPVMSAAEGREKLLSVLSNPQKKIIGALVDQGEVSREQLGADTDYSPSSGGFNNLLGSLRTLGLIDYPRPGLVMMSAWAQELLSGWRAAA
ncbi:MAG TPA: hypothetical protein VKX28_26710 [Xanthobacteraceae bacterium]|nr:hypothetical protein [Xanthobacteraceae bacterium]